MNLIKNLSIKPSSLICTFCILILSACASSQLSYSIDPEISTIKNFASQSTVVAVSVNDMRQALENSADSDEITKVVRQKDEALVIRTKLMDSLKNNGFKIISNKLLADVALELDIVEFEVSFKSNFFKSELMVTSHLRMKANKQGNTFEKLYKMSRTQEVANPVNNNDLSGIVNQLLSNQLSAIWADPALIELTNG